MAGNGRDCQTFQDLIDVGLLEIGDGYRAKNEELDGTGTIFLRAGHVTDTHIDFEGVERFRTELADRLKPKMAAVGDTIMTTKGNSTGRTSYVSSRMPPFVYSPHLSYWRSLDHNRLAPGFLRYWSRGKEFNVQLNAMKVSTDMAPYLSLTDQKRLRITLPSASEQKAIAHILGTLDDKIELNRRMNETLEAMARAIFKSWVVDGDPVRANRGMGILPMNRKRGKRGTDFQPVNAEHGQYGQATVGGLSPDVAALSPDSFEDSELGRIPRGWQIRTLKELAAKIGSGATPRGGEKVYVNHGVALVRSQNVYDGDFRWEGLARITAAAANELESVTLEPEDVLFNLTGASILRTCVVDSDVLPARVNQHVARIRACPPVSSRFLHLHLVRQEMKEFLIGFNAGATREAVTKGHLESIRIVTPPAGLFPIFDAIVTPLYSQVQNNMRQTRVLAAHRDVLLPKLLSGEIRARDADKVVEATL
jgi:type I restriction enzyme S subunit